MNRPVQRDGIEFFFICQVWPKSEDIDFLLAMLRTQMHFLTVFLFLRWKKPECKKSVHSFIEKSFISGFRKQRKSWFKGSAFFQTQNFEKRVQVSRINLWESCVVFFNRNFLLRFVGFDITVCPFCMLLHPDFERDELSFSIQSIERARFCQECQFQSLWQMVGPSFFWGNRLGGGLSPFPVFFHPFFWNLDLCVRPWGWKGAKSPVICWRSHVYVRGAQEPWKSPPNWPPFFFYDQRNAHLGGQSEGERGFHIFFQLLQAGNHGRWRIFCLVVVVVVVVVVVAEIFDLSLWKPSVVGFHVESQRATFLSFLAAAGSSWGRIKTIGLKRCCLLPSHGQRQSVCWVGKSFFFHRALSRFFDWHFGHISF